MSISSTDPLWADLINSDWRDYRGSGAREDRISNDSWLREFLDRAGWSGRLPGTVNRTHLRDLRSLLLRIVGTLIAENRIDTPDLNALNTYLARSPEISNLEQRDSGWHLSQVAVKSGFERVLAAISFSFASILANGDPARIKICANPDCGWVIYDESHNRTRRWCDLKECGNLIRVRRFRARRLREGHPTVSPKKIKQS